MKQLSKLIYIHDEHFRNAIPPEVDFLPVTKTDLPLYLQDGALDPKICDQIADNLRQQRGAHRVTTVGREGDRKTYALDISADDLAIYKATIENEKRAINEFFSLKLGGSDGGVQVLGYPPGARYGGHSDNCTPIFDENGKFSQFKCLLPQRVISTILFLSDSVDEIHGPNQCVGGNVSFNHLEYKDGETLLVEPKKGRLVAFPSNPYFGHEVHEVYDGYRISIVEWFNAEFQN